MHKLEFRLYILNLLRGSTHKVNVELKNFTYKPPGKGEEDKKNLPHTNTVSVHIKCVNVATIVNGSFSTLRNKLRFSHCFKYRPSRSRYRSISRFLPTADMIWENLSPISFAAKSGRYLKYRSINRST